MKKIFLFIFFLISGLLLIGDYTIRVSLDSNGIQGNAGSAYPSISADGRYVAFHSWASNLVTDDTNEESDIFVYDCHIGRITRVSVDSNGQEANYSSRYPAISANGRFVAFESSATNLTANDTNKKKDIFVHDCLTGETTMVSVNSGGVQGNEISEYCTISADGRYVAFKSYSDNLVVGDKYSQDIFVHDRYTGETSLVSVDSAGNQVRGSSYEPSISADGRYVAFRSWSADFVDNDTNGNNDIFVHGRHTGETTRVSVNSSGAEADDDCYTASISCDGRYVAFYSKATNLSFIDDQYTSDIFVHDRQTGQTTLVSKNSDGKGANGFSHSPSISGDGRYVAFSSTASNLVLDDTNGERDIFVHDIQTGRTKRISVASYGIEGNDSSYNPSISFDGRFTAFESDASNLVPGDTNEVQDIFVRVLTAAPTVKTYPISDITAATALSGGNVLDQGAAEVTTRGVCWSTSPDPTTADDYTTDGSGTGDFTSLITGLTPGTTYHVRAYATNSRGTGYGNDLTFKTLNIPTVITSDVSAVTATTAACGGNVVDDGGAAVTVRGVCWSTSPHPTTADSFTTNGSGTGTFTSSITGLTPGTIYYIRAYATNPVGTAYGDTLTFQTRVNPVISGNITHNGVGLQDVTLTFSNFGETTRTDGYGNYSHTVPYNWSGAITPSKPGYVFAPSERTYNSVISDIDSQNHVAYFTVLTLQAARKTEGAWLIKKQYGKIEMEVENEGNIPAPRCILYRKESDGEYQVIAEIPGSQFQGNSYLYEDKFLNPNKSYTYKFTAVDVNGVLISASNEITI